MAAELNTDAGVRSAATADRPLSLPNRRTGGARGGVGAALRVQPMRSQTSATSRARATRSSGGSTVPELHASGAGAVAGPSAASSLTRNPGFREGWLGYERGNSRPSKQKKRLSAVWKASIVERIASLNMVVAAPGNE